MMIKTNRRHRRIIEFLKTTYPNPVSANVIAKSMKTLTAEQVSAIISKILSDYIESQKILTRYQGFIYAYILKPQYLDCEYELEIIWQKNK